MEKKRDLSLDFMKGLAILLVIVEHSISSEYVDSFRQIVPISAVPFFFAITMYLSFGKLERSGNIFNTWFTTKRIKSIWQHIFKPYIIVMLFSVLIILLIGHNYQFINGLLGGGVWPWLILCMGLLASLDLYPVHVFHIKKEWENNWTYSDINNMCFTELVLFRYRHVRRGI